MIGKTFYYEKFIVEDQIRLIPDFEIRRNFWTYYYSILIFCGDAPMFAAFIGYDFSLLLVRVMFGCNLFFSFWMFYFYVRFNRLCIEYPVFRKKLYQWLFSSIPVLICIVFSALPALTACFYPDAVHFLNPTLFNLGFLPSLFAYMCYAFYAFLRVFAKYAQRSTEVDIVRGGRC